MPLRFNLGSLVVNSTGNYTFNGAAIGGTTGLTKNNTGTLVLQQRQQLQRHNRRQPGNADHR